MRHGMNIIKWMDYTVKFTRASGKARRIIIRALSLSFITLWCSSHHTTQLKLEQIQNSPLNKIVNLWLQSLSFSFSVNKFVDWKAHILNKCSHYYIYIRLYHCLKLLLNKTLLLSFRVLCCFCACVRLVLFLSSPFILLVWCEPSFVTVLQ